MNIFREKQRAQGWHYLCSDAPDTSKQQEAALQMSALSKEQLDWAKQIYSETAPDRADAIARAKQVSDANLEAMNTQTAIAKDYQDYQTNTFRPLEQGIVADAESFDTESRRAEKSNQAIAGVGMQADAAAQQVLRAQNRAGVNPSSGKAMAIASQMGLGAAAAKAGAGNAARDAVEVQGYARKMDAANLGRGLASNQATTAGLAMNAGNASAANMAATGGISGQGAALMNSGYSGAQAGLGNAASTYGSIASLQNQSGGSGIMGLAGTALGSFLGGPGGGVIGGKLGNLFK